MELRRSPAVSKSHRTSESKICKDCFKGFKGPKQKQMLKSCKKIVEGLSLFVANLWSNCRPEAGCWVSWKHMQIISDMESTTVGWQLLPAERARFGGLWFLACAAAAMCAIRPRPTSLPDTGQLYAAFPRSSLLKNMQESHRITKCI